jgi:two-component system CheB/CheR fusion protein
VNDEDQEPAEAAALPTPGLDDPEWPALLGYLETARGFDFLGYKPNTLARRIRKRMSALGIQTFAVYHDYLEVHQEEFATLFDTILINVTSFFRDPPAWETLRTLALPAIVGAARTAMRRACGSGARGAPPARRPTPSPSCLPSISASRLFASE